MIKSRYTVFWGAAIVIFLAKIINFHNANTQGFWVEVSSQVETGELNMRLRFRSSNFSISRAFHRHQHWPHPLASVGHIQCVASFKHFLVYNRPVYKKKEYGRFGGINEKPSKFVRKPAFHNYSMQTTFQTLFTTHTMYMC